MVARPVLMDQVQRLQQQDETANVIQARLAHSEKEVD